jgi:hypothetical protein
MGDGRVRSGSGFHLAHHGNGAEAQSAKGERQPLGQGGKTGPESCRSRGAEAVSRSLLEHTGHI